MRKLYTLGLVSLAVLAGYAAAQTATRFAAIRVDGTSDLRGAMLAKLTTVASDSSAAGLNLPAGSAPSSPVNGDVWTTSAGMFVRINGVTVGPLSAGSSPTTGSFTATWAAACTTAASNDWNYTVFGGIVALRMVNDLSCTSNQVTFNSDAGVVPAAIRPAGQVDFNFASAEDNGVTVNACVQLRISTAGTMTVARAATSISCNGIGANGWTNSGVKALRSASNSGGNVFTYPLN